MPKNHLKTANSPKTWELKRKNVVFTTRPNPGAHKIELSMPINLVFRNLLKKAETNKEIKKILHEQEVLVNGKRRKDTKYSVGLLDILTIPKLNESYLMLIGTRNKLFMELIDKKEATQKISKITDKKIVKKGITQLKTFDGRTLLVKKDTFKTGDSILISVPEQEVKETLKLEKGASILLYKGKYVGVIATIEEIKGQVLKFKKDKEILETKKDYAIVIGKDKPLIKIK